MNLPVHCVNIFCKKERLKVDETNDEEKRKKNTKDTTVDIDSRTAQFRFCPEKCCNHVYDHAWIYLFLGKYVGRPAAGDGLDFWGFLGSLLLGGAILGIYTGLLGYVGAKTG